MLEHTTPGAGATAEPSESPPTSSRRAKPRTAAAAVAAQAAAPRRTPSTERALTGTTVTRARGPAFSSAAPPPPPPPLAPLPPRPQAPPSVAKPARARALSGGLVRNPTAPLQVTSPPQTEMGLEIPLAPMRSGKSTVTRARKAPAPVPTIPPPSPVAPAPVVPPPSSARSTPSATVARVLTPPPAPAPVAVPAPAPAPAPSPPPAPLESVPAFPSGKLDEDLIAQYQLVERYLAGQLPAKVNQEFERFCRDNPRFVTETGMHERVRAGMDLLVATGHAIPPPVAVTRPSHFRLHAGWLLGSVALLGGALWLTINWSTSLAEQLAQWKLRYNNRPVAMTTGERDIRVLPSRDGPPPSPDIVITSKGAQLLAFHIDESRSQYKLFRVTIDRINQGRVQVIENQQKDSNGHLLISVNSSTWSPGNYLLSIEGVTPNGLEPDSWLTIGIAPDK